MRHSSIQARGKMDQLHRNLDTLTLWRARVMAAASIACFLSACTKTVVVPTSEYAGLRPAARVQLEVETSEGRYRVLRFTTTDSTFVIEEVKSGSTYPDNPRFANPPYLPYPVPFTSIRSIQQVKDPYPIVDAVGGGVFVLVAFFGLVFA